MIGNEDLAGAWQPEPDDLTRDELRELAHLPWAALADVLDEWLMRTVGICSGRHNVGLFLELLHDRDLDVVRDEIPKLITPLLAPPTE